MPPGRAGQRSGGDDGVEAYTSSDDVSSTLQSCAVDGSQMRCTSSVTKRVCHVDESEVPCDSL